MGYLLQIADELRARLPEVIRHPTEEGAPRRARRHRGPAATPPPGVEPNVLEMMWAYKYDQKGGGIAMHADHAVTNVNIWLTPDEANLDPSKGGLVVYRKPAPLDWTFDDYNCPSMATSAACHGRSRRCR